MIFSYAIVVPMANEEDDFEAFVAVLREALDRFGSGAVYFVVDGVSKDATHRPQTSALSRSGRQRTAT